MLLFYITYTRLIKPISNNTIKPSTPKNKSPIIGTKNKTRHICNIPTITVNVKPIITGKTLKNIFKNKIVNKTEIIAFIALSSFIVKDYLTGSSTY